MANNPKTNGRSDDSLLARLKELLWTAIDEDYRETVDIDTMTAETELRTLPLDSLALIELNYGIEEAFDLYISEEQASEFATVGDIMRHLQARLAINEAL